MGVAFDDKAVFHRQVGDIRGNREVFMAEGYVDRVSRGAGLVPLGFAEIGLDVGKTIFIRYCLGAAALSGGEFEYELVAVVVIAVSAAVVAPAHGSVLYAVDGKHAGVLAVVGGERNAGLLIGVALDIKADLLELINRLYDYLIITEVARIAADRLRGEGEVAAAEGDKR